MNRITSAFVALAVMASAPAAAQQSELQLPDYTPEQRWQRAGNALVTFQAALIELGKKNGMTAEEVGTFVGEFISQSWLSGQEADRYAVAMNRNHQAWPGASAEVISSTATTAEVRFNRPWEAIIGRDKQHIGVTTWEFTSMNQALNDVISDWVGIDVKREADGDYDHLTLRTEYGPIQASDGIRWARGAYLSWLNFYQVLELKMESGMTAREVGREAGELYGPGWTSRTPFSLYRGMIWNRMGDPNTDCEVLSASPTEVRARCATDYTEERLAQSANLFAVTMDDLLENGRAFSESVAEQLGMRWEETWGDGYREIRVTWR